MCGWNKIWEACDGMHSCNEIPAGSPTWDVKRIHREPPIGNSTDAFGRQLWLTYEMVGKIPEPSKLTVEVSATVSRSSKNFKAFACEQIVRNRQHDYQTLSDTCQNVCLCSVNLDAFDPKSCGTSFWFAQACLSGQNSWFQQCLGYPNKVKFAYLYCVSVRFQWFDLVNMCCWVWGHCNETTCTVVLRIWSITAVVLILICRIAGLCIDMKRNQREAWWYEMGEPISTISIIVPNNWQTSSWRSLSEIVDCLTDLLSFTPSLSEQ